MSDTATQARDAIQKATGGKVDASTFPSGAIALTVRADDKVASIMRGPDGPWGVSVDWAADEGLTGHDHEIDGGVDDLVVKLRDLLAAK